ncbi:hypothetical protein KUA24_84 [Vibrio phage HNL01]|nr:hypothetical protein KUA24_84 [Vibrio phage HNL01]
MEKVKIRDTKIFKQVAKVIGEKQAEIELFKTNSIWTEKGISDILSGCNVCAAFKWDDTVQGYDFWLSISTGNKPLKR